MMRFPTWAGLLDVVEEVRLQLPNLQRVEGSTCAGKPARRANVISRARKEPSPKRAERLNLAL
jgi:hypothetical protein